MPYLKPYIYMFQSIIVGIWLVVSNIFHFYPYKLEMIQFDEHIFQMGWNQQLVNGCFWFP